LRGSYQYPEELPYAGDTKLLSRKDFVWGERSLKGKKGVKGEMVMKKKPLRVVKRKEGKNPDYKRKSRREKGKKGGNRKKLTIWRAEISCGGQAKRRRRFTTEPLACREGA